MGRRIKVTIPSAALPRGPDVRMLPYVCKSGIGEAVVFAGQKLMAILSALVNQERTALEIVEAVDGSTKGRVRITTGSIYTQLERLEREKLVRGNYRQERLGDRRGRPRRYYKLLAKGQSVLNDLDSIRGLGVSRA